MESANLVLIVNMNISLKISSNQVESLVSIFLKMDHANVAIIVCTRMPAKSQEMAVKNLALAQAQKMMMMALYREFPDDVGD